MKYILAIFFIILTYSTSYSQSLNANPWENENTKEQINKAFQQRHLRFYSSPNPQHIDKTTSYQQQIPQKKNIFDKLGSIFDKSSNNTNEEISIPRQHRKRTPKKLSAPKRTASTSTPLLSTPVNSDTNSKELFSMPKFDIPTMPSSDSLIRKFERTLKIDIKKMKRQFRGK